MKYIYVLLLGLLCGLPSSPSARDWRNKDGATFPGELLGIDKGAVILSRDSDRRLFRIPVTDLSLEDQQFVAERKKYSPLKVEAFALLPEGIRQHCAVYYGFDDAARPGVDSSQHRPHTDARAGQLTSEPDGYLGSAARFNGKNSTIHVGKLMALRNQPLTVSCWIRTASEAEQEIFTFGRSGHGFSLHTEKRSVCWTYRWNNGRESASDVRYNKTPVTDGGWHHICAAINENAEVVLWVDGRRVTDRPARFTADEPVHGATIGAVADSKDNVRRSRDSVSFDGLIDELMILRRALSDKEVEDLFVTYQTVSGR